MSRKPVNAIKGKQGFQRTGPKSPTPTGGGTSAAAVTSTAASSHSLDGVPASLWQRFKARVRTPVTGAKEELKPGPLGGRRRKMAVAAAALASVSFLAACESDADVASMNLSTAAEQFEIERRIVFFNGITDQYLLEINGKCSVETGDSALAGSLEVTCKTGENEYKKHFLGLSDNVSYFVEQVDGADVSTYNYRVIFKPDVIVPDMEVNTQAVP